jgi:lysine-N-methylase
MASRTVFDSTRGRALGQESHHTMGLPLLHLPVVQNWDCHVCGTCCKEYRVRITEEEHKRIEAQGWANDPVVGGLPLFGWHGPWWDRKPHLNHRPDGSCVFLNENGRCRIHERFGYETKPLPCRLFPFVLVPVADKWRVGMRFACPSAAANKGRPAPKHDEELQQFASMLAVREGLQPRPDGSLIPPPPLQGGQRVEWPDLLRFMDALLKLLRNRKDRVERRLRKCLMLAHHCRQANFTKITGDRLGEFLNLISASLEGEVPADPLIVPPPTGVGRILFRLAAALYTRKDHGPNRGPAITGRIGLINAAWRFARGTGPLPRLHGWIPDARFERMEEPAGPLSPAAEELLERYYVLKVGSMQFCGPAYFGLPFWEGLESLAITFPIMLWLRRAFSDLSSEDALMKAVSIVDDHFGFNPVLSTARQRLSFWILSGWGELPRLIAWYSR